MAVLHAQKRLLASDNPDAIFSSLNSLTLAPGNRARIQTIYKNHSVKIEEYLQGKSGNKLKAAAIQVLSSVIAETPSMYARLPQILAAIDDLLAAKETELVYECLNRLVINQAYPSVSDFDHLILRYLLKIVQQPTSDLLHCRSAVGQCAVFILEYYHDNEVLLTDAFEILSRGCMFMCPQSTWAAAELPHVLHDHAEIVATVALLGIRTFARGRHDFVFPRILDRLIHASSVAEK